ncbi:MAG TPA: hypothetical protein VMS17_03600 [Gemmataceae bacterium]|nr:hypothetical protein [Gemmataceae bacterium]
MARKGLCLLLAAAILFAAPLRSTAAPNDDKDKKILNLLAVQKALQEGRDALKRGDYQAAVTVLEARIACIEGDKAYLDALRDAYVGYIRELQKNNQSAEAATYRRRLECCDPGALLEINAALHEAVAVAAPAKVVAAPTPPATDERSNAKAVLEEAEKEFAARRYGEAGRLYGQCNQADPSLIADAKERWAYCLLFVVVDACKNAPADKPAPPEWEHDVRLALSMAPDNKAISIFAGDLLNKLQERRGPTVRAVPEDAPAEVEVRHTARQAGQAWAVAETANFRIFHNQSREVAEKAAQTAETARTTAAKKWFGETAPPWNQRCDIYLHATAQDYSLATKMPPGLAGHSTFGRRGAEVISRRIDLHCDDPNVFIGVLPHETTHVVLADRFGQALPHWADEGMAVLSEPRDRIDLHLHNLPQHRANGELFPVAELMRMDDYPDRSRIGAFYAESVSLVEFLAKEKGYPTFALFMRDALQGGNFEQALQRYYDIRGFDDLQQRWQHNAFGQ